MTPQMELIASPSTNCRPTYACASVQTELTFEPDCFVTFDSHPVEVVEDESEEEEPVSSTDPLWIPVEEEQPEEEMPETVSEENPATELKVIVFWKQLLLLLQCCQICKAPAHVYERVQKGTLIIAKLLCANNHCSEWRSQPMMRNGTAAGNLLFPAAILYLLIFHTSQGSHD